MDFVVFDDMKMATEQEVNRLLPLVPAFRREQALRFRHIFGQFCCLQSWCMWRDMMSSRLAPEKLNAAWQYHPQGKPYLDGAPDFSISHCRTAIAVAVSDRQVGIDIESIRPADESLIAYTMNEEEQTLIHASDDPSRAFTRLWTMKEAYLKYVGSGITDNLRDALLPANPAFFHVQSAPAYVCSIYTV